MLPTSYLHTNQAYGPEIRILERINESNFRNIDNYHIINDSFKMLLVDLYESGDGKIHESGFDAFTFEEVISFLSVSHQYYIKKLIPEIEQSIHYAILQNEDTEIWNTIFQFFNTYKHRLLEHIEEEEKTIFPAILKLSSMGISRTNMLHFPDLLPYFDAHDTIEEELAEVITIINHYSAPIIKNMPLQIFLHQIQKFEIELRLHAQIEDLILMPKLNIELGGI